MPNISAVWHFFEKIDEKSAICNTCGAKLLYASSVSNLKKHLGRKHPTEHDEIVEMIRNKNFIPRKNEKDPIYTIIISKNEEDLANDEREVSEEIFEYEENSEGDEDTKIKELRKENSEINVRENLLKDLLSSGDKSNFEPPPKKIKLNDIKQIDYSLLKMIVYDLHPISIIDDVGFRLYTNALNPNYVIPDRQKLSLNLQKTYEKRMEQLKLYVQNHAKRISLTIDIWTSINMDVYMAITAHFIKDDTIELTSVMIRCCQFETSQSSSEIYLEIKEILEEWDIYDKITFFVTNCESPTLNCAFKYLESDRMVHFSCIAHKLNKIVENALAEISSIIDKVRRLADYFQKNRLASESLINYQITNQNCLKPKELIKSFPKTWNTTYLMFDRFLELKQAIKITVLKLDENCRDIDEDEWNIIEKMYVILKPFYEATIEIYSESFLVASKTMALISSLSSIYENYTKLKSLYLPVQKLVEKIFVGLVDLRENLETNLEIGLSTILDPRFKIKPIKNSNNMINIKTELISKMTEEIQKKPQPANFTSSMTKTDTLVYQSNIPAYSLWNEFEDETSISPKSPIIIAKEELEKYVAEPLLKRNFCPYTWWRENKFLYPTLFELFKRHCNIMLSSIPCERVFTKSGYMTNVRKMRLSSSEISQIVFLNENKMDD